MTRIMKLFSVVTLLLVFAVPCFSATTVADKAKAEGFEVVDFNYVKAKIGNGLKKKDFLPVDARPGRIFAKGFIPGAYNLPDMKFKKVYPDFEKLNVAKDMEIVLGVGKDCPLSFNVAKKLRGKGYTNLKLYVKPGIWMQDSYMQVEYKAAKKMYGKGISFIDARPERVYKKGTIDGAINIPDNKFSKFVDQLPSDTTKPVVVFCGGYSCVKSHNVANEMKKMGYKTVLVYAAGFPDWKKNAK